MLPLTISYQLTKYLPRTSCIDFEWKSGANYKCRDGDDDDDDHDDDHDDYDSFDEEDYEDVVDAVQSKEGSNCWMKALYVDLFSGVFRNDKYQVWNDGARSNQPYLTRWTHSPWVVWPFWVYVCSGPNFSQIRNTPYHNYLLETTNYIFLRLSRCFAHWEFGKRALEKFQMKKIWHLPRNS